MEMARVELRIVKGASQPCVEFFVDGEDFRKRVCKAMGEAAVARSGRYSWSITAARLRRLYGDLVARTLVQCR